VVRVCCWGWWGCCGVRELSEGTEGRLGCEWREEEVDDSEWK